MMSFDEIGAELGISRGAAGSIYSNAMRKLRRRPHSLARLIELSEMLGKARSARQQGGNNAITL